ncbi:MAG: ATP-binding cassette domain-containing protein [Agathobacter sp.]|nr:ATP-binding cassette domain-containing protein [Agathobacter sp.]
MKLEIKDLSKNYSDVQALKSVHLCLEPGIYGLLGPNGAGKSTLINLLTDNIKRDSGEILWNEEEILRMGKAYRKLLGYMPQQQGCYEDFSAGAFLIYIGQLKGMSKKEAEAKSIELLKTMNLDDVMHKKIGEFSGGMKQRLLLAQALLNDPKILILDEPTAGVDPQERIRIRNYISEIAADKIVILATHIVSDVEAIAKEIILLKKGAVIQSGSPYKLINKINEKIYEVHIKQEELEIIQKRYTVGNIRYTGEGVAVKIIADDPPTEYEHRNVFGNLEDVYLYYFHKGA